MLAACDVNERWDSSASLCLIPARGGSEGVPGKNIRPLAGLPLVAYSIRAASASGVFDEVWVSTEDQAISEVAAAYGARTIARPLELARHDTPMAPVVEHAVESWERETGMPPHNIFLLQPSSPLTASSDILRAASLLSSGECDSAMGVFEADDPPQWGLRATPDGWLRPVAEWQEYLSRRQDLPPTYFDGPVYAIETGAFLAGKRFLTDRTRFFLVPRLRAIDIDTEFDLMFAEFLLKHGRESDERAVHPRPPASPSA
jgi:CMP-N,N'-diacetyllegionaminic acid synthase